jgi:hypothetical protein
MPPTPMDGPSTREAMHRTSAIAIRGRNITETKGITRRSGTVRRRALTWAVAIRAALEGTREASAVATGVADVAERGRAES